MQCKHPAHHQLFSTSRVRTKQSLFTNPVSQTHVGDQPASRSNVRRATIITRRGGERKKASSLHYKTAPRLAETDFAMYLTVLAIVHRVGGSIGCLIVVKALLLVVTVAWASATPGKFPEWAEELRSVKEMAGSHLVRNNARNLKIEIAFLEAI